MQDITVEVAHSAQGMNEPAWHHHAVDSYRSDDHGRLYPHFTNAPPTLYPNSWVWVRPSFNVRVGPVGDVFPVERWQVRESNKGLALVAVFDSGCDYSSFGPMQTIDLIPTT
jgi:hypothetical protein